MLMSTVLRSAAAEALGRTVSTGEDAFAALPVAAFLSEKADVDLGGRARTCTAGPGGLNAAREL